MSSVVTSRYAKALFATASKPLQKKLLDAFEDTLLLYQENRDFKRFLNAPEIKITDKKRLLSDIFKDHAEFLHFVFLLLKKGRINILPKIAEAYRDIHQNIYGTITVTFETAVPVEDHIKEAIVAKLDRSFGKKFALDCHINPDIIGGGALIVRGQMIDFSVQDKLERLKIQLLS